MPMAAHAETHLSADVADAQVGGPDAVARVWCPHLLPRPDVTLAATSHLLLASTARQTHADAPRARPRLHYRLLTLCPAAY